MDPTFRNINRLFIQSFEDCNSDPTRNFFKYFMSLVEIKDFNILIDNKPNFEQPIKNKQRFMKNWSKMSRNDEFITGSLLDYLNLQIYCKLIDVDLSRQMSTSIPQQINLIGKLKEDNGATMIF